MPYRIDIYIGSDNNSKRIDQRYLKRVKNWANKVFPDGYTIIKGKGYYRGTSEDSLILHVLLDYDINLENHLSKLKKELRQEAILVVKSKVDAEVI